MSQIASTITLPSHWACYLINGDASGLDDGEAERIAAHLNAELPADAAIVDVIEDSERFTWSFHLYGGDASGGDVADFTVLQPGARAAVQRAGADDAPAMVPQQVQQQQTKAVSVDVVQSGRMFPRSMVRATGPAGECMIPYDFGKSRAENLAAGREALRVRMVPMPVQQQQGRDARRGMARCDYPGCWQIGVWTVQKGGGCGRWVARASGPGTIGNGSPQFFDTLAEAYLALTGESMPGAPVMVPQQCQQQQANARRPARGERRYVTVRDTETGETHRVLTSVARVGVAVVIFVPSNRHRAGALGGMLITHDDVRKAWVFNDEAEARRMLSRNRAPGERVIRAELISDPAGA